MRRRSFLAAMLTAPLSSLAPTIPAAPVAARVPDSVVLEIARRYRVSRHAVARMAAIASQAFPADPVLVLAMIGTESSWRPWTIGAAGEVGLCQVRPDLHSATAAALADPEINVRVAARILRAYAEQYGLREGVARFNGKGQKAVDYCERVLSEHRLLTRV